MKKIHSLLLICISPLLSFSQDADFTIDSYTICEGTCIDFYDASEGVNISSWIWEFEGADESISILQNPSNICFDAQGVYAITLTIEDDHGSSTITKEITVEECSGNPPTAAFSVDTLTICAGDCISFTDQSQGEPSFWYWEFDGGEPATSNEQHPENVCFSTAGTHTVRLTISNANGSDNIVNPITVHEGPAITGTGDTLIEVGGAANLYAESEYDGFIFWEPWETVDCDTCNAVIATPTITTTYYPSIEGENGCIGRDTIVVEVKGDAPIGVPSAFTPNSRYGENTTIRVLGDAIASIDFKIYNLYGKLVFQTQRISEEWDGTLEGKPLNQGVFVYTLTYELKNGTTGEQTGNITLIK